MEFKLKNKGVEIFQINDDVIYEEMDGQGYFFVSSTDKIIIMNESSYFLWQVIQDHSRKSLELTIEEMVNMLQEKFDVSGMPVETLRNDIELALFHFVNEDFLRAVSPNAL